MKKWIEPIVRVSTLIKCLWSISKRSFIVALRSRSGKASRRFVTKYLRLGGLEVLKYVQAKYKISGFPIDQLDLKRPTIFMSNHLSLFDLPLIVATIALPIRVVIKKELVCVPFLGKAALASEQVIVDRNPAVNKENFYNEAEKKLLSGIRLWIFPEGTRSKSGRLQAFKTGGFRLAEAIGAQIVPVAIIGSNEILPAGKCLPAHHKTLEIKIGQPIDARLYSDIKELSLHTEHSIRLMQSTH